MEPYNMYPSEDVNEFDGDILLYRQVRALEHQAIYQQNIKPSNVNKNNTALGVCVANNQDDIVTKLNSVLKEDLFDHGVIGLLDNSPMTADYLSAVTASLITVNVKS
jgi:hypothetical protein